MTLNPRVGMYLSLAAALLLFAAGASTQLTDLFNPVVARKIVAGATFLGGLVSAANAVLHAIPSEPGKNAEFPLGPKS